MSFHESHGLTAVTTEDACSDYARHYFVMMTELNNWYRAMTPEERALWLRELRALIDKEIEKMGGVPSTTR